MTVYHTANVSGDAPVYGGPGKQGRIMDRRVQRVILLMEQDIRKNLTLSEMAQAVNLSRSHIYHLFRSEMGVSHTRYLKMLRINKAKELLETTFMSVKEIAAAVGANDGSHFVRDFKKQYKITPTQYRRTLLVVLQCAVLLDNIWDLLTRSVFG